jgi:hypothetical protein
MTSNNLSKQIGVQNAKMVYNTFGTVVNGIPNFYTFFMGGIQNPTNVGKNSSTGGNNFFEDANVLNSICFHKTLNKKDIALVVPRIDWSQGTSYHPYRSAGQETGAESFYAYNTNNRIVYMCVSDNEHNRYDLRHTSGSSIEPTHTSGIQKYSDGYSWLPLYKIDWKLQSFLTGKWLPVPSLDEFTEITKSGTFSSSATEMCGSSSTTCGSCCLYHENYFYDSIGDTYYIPGQLYKTIPNIKCYECLEVSRRLGMEVLFTESTTGTNSCLSCTNTPCSCSKETKTQVEKINSSTIPSQNNEKFQSATETESANNDGRIISVFFDAKNLSTSDLTIDDPNPEIEIDSSTGSGAVLKFKTHKDSYKNNIIHGIEVISSGSNYKDIQIISAQGFESKIEINIDKVDGIAVNPAELLGACNIMYNIQFRSSEISDGVGTTQKSFKFYGIARNVELKSSNNTKILGSDKQEKEATTFYRATDKYTILTADMSSFEEADLARFTGKENISAGQMQSVSLDDTTPTNKELEVFVNPSTDETDRTSASGLVNSSDTSTSFNIVSRDISDVVPGSGNVVYTKTSTSISLPSVGEPTQLLTFRIVKSYC